MKINYQFSYSSDTPIKFGESVDIYASSNVEKGRTITKGELPSKTKIGTIKLTPSQWFSYEATWGEVGFKYQTMNEAFAALVHCYIINRCL